eukprot:TRINITY_DN17317_c0_g1_i2.p1 TRINITY_DN17317_c0_g1~~TRINITY_DN17317_c0_g1_i2.p1  ORF type:complete len:111 (+),score=1.59 TRINITY_DN17317_c0_g1_i2:106-438(+)
MSTWIPMLHRAFELLIFHHDMCLIIYIVQLFSTRFTKMIQLRFRPNFRQACRREGTERYSISAAAFFWYRKDSDSTQGRTNHELAASVVLIHIASVAAIGVQCPMKTEMS